MMGEGIIFSTNSSGTTGYPQAKKKKKSRHRPYTFQEKLTQNVS